MLVALATVSVAISSPDFYYLQRQLFPICNCGFGIWLNFDAVLRYSRATMCGIAVFVPPLRPPPHQIVCSLGKPFHTKQPDYFVLKMIISLLCEPFRNSSLDHLRFVCAI